MPSARTLLLIIFLEGYVVLSLEVLAIRQAINFIGSNTDKISVIIAAVLVPLAFGYYYGGRYRPYRNEEGRLITRRIKLLQNVALSSGFVLVAISYPLLMLFFACVQMITGTLDDFMLLSVIYAAILIFTPCFLLGQTVPLVSNFFERQKAAAVTGKILLASTLGSFMGAVFCTLVVMKYLGVNYAVPLTMLCLFLLTVLAARWPVNRYSATTLGMLGAALFLNSPYVLHNLKIVEQNVYNTLKVQEAEPGVRVLYINNSPSSRISDEGDRKTGYIDFVEDYFIEPLREDGPKLSILVIGAGGFTLGLGDTKNEYTYVDIDPAMQDVAETYFLKRKLAPNAVFVAAPARGFLRQPGERYDLIFIDAFSGFVTIPEHLLTAEFLIQAADHLKENGILTLNMLTSPNFSDRLSVRFDSTFTQVFPLNNRQPVNGYDLWDRNPKALQNVIYVGYNTPPKPRQMITGERPP